MFKPLKRDFFIKVIAPLRLRLMSTSWMLHWLRLRRHLVALARHRFVWTIERMCRYLGGWHIGRAIVFKTYSPFCSMKRANTGLSGGVWLTPMIPFCSIAWANSRSKYTAVTRWKSGPRLKCNTPVIWLLFGTLEQKAVLYWAEACQVVWHVTLPLESQKSLDLYRWTEWSPVHPLDANFLAVLKYRCAHATGFSQWMVLIVKQLNVA